MADAIPPPPSGFTVDADPDAASSEPIPAPPAGFKLDNAAADTPKAQGAVENPGDIGAGQLFGDMAKGIAGPVAHVAGTLADVFTGTSPGAGSHAERWSAPFAVTDELGQLTPAQQKAHQAVGSAVSSGYDKIAGTGPLAQTVKERVPQAAEAISAVVPVLRAADAAAPVAASIPRTVANAARSYAGRPLAGAPAATPAIASTAESILANQVANSPTSMGAAATVPDISNISPNLRSAVVQAGQSGAPIPLDVLNRHTLADTLPQPEGTSPLQLRKGQATRDDQQISDEKNMRADADTQGILADSINDQDAKLASSMGEIRRRATPDIVQRSTPEHAQANIDALKTQDNAAVSDIRAKYKALADQNGGAMPIDTGAVVGQVQQGLSKGFLTKTAANNPVVSEVMDSLTSGRPMSFEQFENARTNLAAVQRLGGSDAAAAGIVHNALENMPLTQEAQGLKDMADVARNAAKARFQTIEQNPAYEAAINDNVPKDANGLHAIGASSPLADKFMDQYFLGNGPTASRAYVQRIKGVMQESPDFSQSIEAAALNKLRAAAGLDEYDVPATTFQIGPYRNARNAMNPKADALLSPQSAAHTDQLKQVANDVGYEGKSSSTNRSNTALTLQRFGAVYPSDPTVLGHMADVGADLAAGHAGPVGILGKRIGQGVIKNSRNAKAAQALKDAKLKFAQDAVAPGAGLSPPAKAAGGSIGTIARASGGKVDHDALVERLYQRWKSAKRDTDKSTKGFLGVPDAAIIRALEVAQEHI